MKKIVITLVSLFWIVNANAEPPSNSVFWLNSVWVRHDGDKIKLKDLGSSPTIISMVFLGCKYSCPLTIQDMREIDEKLQKTAATPHKMVLISIDPDRDTPEAMRKFMKERKLDPTRWILLSSSSKNIRELAAALGYNYKKDNAMDFAHSMLTWIFDKNGVKQFTREARKQSVDETVAAFKKIRDSTP